MFMPKYKHWTHKSLNEGGRFAAVAFLSGKINVQAKTSQQHKANVMYVATTL